MNGPKFLLKNISTARLFTIGGLKARIFSALHQSISADRCKILWDIGGSNGFLSWLLTRHIQDLQSYNIDPIAHLYPKRERVHSLSITSERALTEYREGRLLSPDVILISWPTTGLSHRQVINEVQPKLIIRATDEERVCEVRRGHRAIDIQDDHAKIYGLVEAFDHEKDLSPPSQDDANEYDDLDPPHGYEVFFDEMCGLTAI